MMDQSSLRASVSDRHGQRILAKGALSCSDIDQPTISIVARMISNADHSFTN
jgi:hypothetical protein